jgi:hypothetical protein
LEIHRPKKPIESWREFLVEVGIIVLGVVIALAAEEAVQHYNTRQEVAVVTDSLNDELSDALYSALERIKLDPCQQQSLARLDELADDDAPVLDAKAVPSPPLRLWSAAAWEAAVASGTIEDMPHDERNAYARLFSFVRSLGAWNERERQLWALVDTYDRPRPTTPDSRRRFAETVAQLRALNQQITLASKQFVDAARPLHLRLPSDEAAKIEAPTRCAPL